MDIIKSFYANNASINVLIKGTIQEPLFCASDVGDALKLSNTKNLITKLDETEKVIMNGDQPSIFLTEKGVYKISFYARKSNTMAFHCWLCDVIKELRVQEKYELEQQIVKQNEELTKYRKKVEKKYLREDRIYVFEDKTSKGALVYKIGFSGNFKERLITYETSRYENTLMFEIPCNNGRILEQTIHHTLRQYKDYHKKEWFHTDINTIKITITFLQDILDNLTSIENLSTLLPLIQEKYLNVKQQHVQSNEDNLIQKFLDECCIRDDNAKCKVYEAMCRYRFWNDGLTKTEMTEFRKYMKGIFKYGTIWDETHKISHQVYKGVRILDIEFKPDVPQTLYDRFIIECCVVTCAARSSHEVLTNEFIKWKTEIGEETLGSLTESIEFRKYLQVHFLSIRGSFIYSKMRDCGGYYGVALKGDTLYDVYHKSDSTKLRKKVYKIDPNTNVVVEIFSSLTEASQKQKNDMYHKVKHGILHHGFLYSYTQPSLQ
jgi:prophage antirepressor-like protein